MAIVLTEKVVLLMDWVPFAIDPGHTNRQKCVSLERYKGMWIVVVINSDPHQYRQTYGVTFESGCFCYQRINGPGRQLRMDDKEVPAEFDSVTVNCDKCKFPLFRVSGIITRDWKLWIPS